MKLFLLVSERWEAEAKDEEPIEREDNLGKSIQSDVKYKYTWYIQSNNIIEW